MDDEASEMKTFIYLFSIFQLHNSKNSIISRKIINFEEQENTECKRSSFMVDERFGVVYDTALPDPI